MASSAKGNVTWCIGNDTTGAFSQVMKLYEQSHPQVHVNLIQLPTSADQQRTQLVQREQAKSSECDILGMDVIWTPKFAGQGWLRDVSPAIQARASEFIPSTLNTTKIGDKYWAVPFNTNAGLLYYNKSKIQTAPTTWQQVYQDAKTSGGFAYQGQSYEGLTVDFLEMVYSAGASVLSPDGKTATIDSPQAQQVLAFMQQGLKDGAVPQANLTYMEEDSRNAFQTGKVSLLRNWPYVYALAKQAHVNFGVVPLPMWAGAKPADVLGGYNLGISTYSKNPGAALSFINFATAPAAQKAFFIKSSLPAVLTTTYHDRAVITAQPFAPQLLTAVEKGIHVRSRRCIRRSARRSTRRLLGAVQRHLAQVGALAGAQPDQCGPEDVLADRGHNRAGNRCRAAPAPPFGPLRAAARGGDGLAVTDRDLARGGVADRVRDLAVAASVQRHPSRPCRDGWAWTTTETRSSPAHFGAQSGSPSPSR